VERIPNVNTLADLIDRLIVEVNKLSWFENKKREEHAKPNPDPVRIAYWDHLSRECCELRSALKNEINKVFGEVVDTGSYRVMKEPRTFKPSATKIADVLAEACRERSDVIAKAMEVLFDAASRE
jgi:hypothetical protein